jgi:hypothetical protein
MGSSFIGILFGRLPAAVALHQRPFVSKVDRALLVTVLVQVMSAAGSCPVTKYRVTVASTQALP